jgi:predicted MFS family arabinose efflux permease
MSQNAIETEPRAAQPAADVPRAEPTLDGCTRERGSLLGLPRVYWLLWTGALINRVGGTVFALLSIYLTRVRGLSPELAGLVLSLYAGGTTVAGPVGGVLADRIGRRATLILATSGAGTFMLMLGFVRAGGASTLVII